MNLPNILLSCTSGNKVNVSTLSGLTVIYIYPKTGNPEKPEPDGWAEIPGAKGCTPQSCSFRDHSEELGELKATVYGLSTQSTSYQNEAVKRLHLPFYLLSDSNLKFAKALALPTMDVERKTLIKRITLICKDSEIKYIFYPVFPPELNADQVIAWIKKNA